MKVPGKRPSAPTVPTIGQTPPIDPQYLLMAAAHMQGMGLLNGQTPNAPAS